jgi:CspA family cold shock protein
VNQAEPAVGRVVGWSAEEGWGVLRSDGVDGLVFAHFSAIRDRTGYRSLEAGQQVWFRWTRPGQDGCEVSAVDVWTAGSPSAAGPGGAEAPPPGVGRPGPSDAYRSRLRITSDPPGGSPPPPP